MTRKPEGTKVSDWSFFSHRPAQALYYHPQSLSPGLGWTMPKEGTSLQLYVFVLLSAKDLKQQASESSWGVLNLARSWGRPLGPQQCFLPALGVSSK